MYNAQLGLRIGEYILNDDFNLRNQHDASCVVVRFVACNVWIAAAVLSLVPRLAAHNRIDDGANSSSRARAQYSTVQYSTVQHGPSAQQNQRQEEAA